ncbi:MAG: chorismate--pyruvate lyase family protein [Pirellulaceae bacterium]
MNVDRHEEPLRSLFYKDPESLARLDCVASNDLPEPFRQLLDHHAHMTVTVEQFHGGPVSVQVLQQRFEGERYLREIVLRTTAESPKVVLYGIVDLNLAVLDPQVRSEILAGKTPLGRILIARQVMRKVTLERLYRVTPGPQLHRLMEGCHGPLFGRSARIDLNGHPALKLLEIVGI